MDELIFLKNPADSDGDTVAHFMAMAGCKFSREEIIAIGNPKNSTGKSIADIIDIKADSPEINEKAEKKIIKFIDKQHNYYVAKYLERSHGILFAAYWCTLFINGMLTAEMENNGSLYASWMKVMNPEVFKLYIRENNRRYQEKFDKHIEIKEVYEPLKLSGCRDYDRFFLKN